jgi:catechol 2,3-dioxygenase-like lactoylglutathione lyase family enzyme
MSVLDHIIIAVEDLEQASQDYALMLGRAPSWRGTHPDYGSANTLFRLDNGYLELLAADKNGGEGWAGDMVRSQLAAHGQSLCGLIFGTDDCDAFLKNARANGLEVSDPVPGSGVDDASGATRTWQTMFWDMAAARGIFSFCIRHDDLAALPIAAVTGSGAVNAIDHVVVQTKSADAAKNFYGAQLGLRLALEQHVPDWGGTQLFFRTNSMSVEVLATEKAGDEDSLWGLALKTDDIVATQKRMSDAGINISDVREGRKPGTKVCTAKSHVCDVPTLLIEHPKA